LILGKEKLWNITLTASSLISVHRKKKQKRAREQKRNPIIQPFKLFLPKKRITKNLNNICKNVDYIIAFGNMHP
jgi:hypothetical protein